VDIRADDTAGAGGNARTLFNAIFDSTPGNYTELQKAEDVQQSTSTTVYDSQGNAYELTTIFTKDATSADRWRWEIKVADAVVTGGYSGYIEFNPDGSLKDFQTDDGSNSLQFNPGNGSSLFKLLLKMAMEWVVWKESLSMKMEKFLEHFRMV